MWDRVNDRLAALPGSSILAIRNGGTIPDRGQFNVYLGDRKTRLGTLDEEFVFETRPGDVFALGSGTWRVLEVDEDKVVVSEAAGAMPRMPFWRGEAPKREYYMGRRVGEFRRLLAARVASLPPLPDEVMAEWPDEALAVRDWLKAEYMMDEHSARNAILYVRRQLDAIGAMSTDRTVVVESFSDAVGDERLVIHSCFGGRVNSAWALALSHALRERYRLDIETQVNDDGILIRLLQADRDLPADLVASLGPDEARRRILLELPDSALFGAQFRMNAARALLLPGVRGSKRTPFWLQRLRARDLLAAVRNYPDFPIVAETYRDCLRDVLDVEHLTDILAEIARGEVRVVEVETVVPSPVAASLLFDFIAVEMYDGDLPKVERQMRVLAINRELLAQLLADGSLPDLLRPEAIEGIAAELQHTAEGYRARSREELAYVFQELGDLSADEVAERSEGEGRAWLLALAAQGRLASFAWPGEGDPATRWASAERYARYREAFGLPDRDLALPEGLRMPDLDPDTAREAVLRQMLHTHGPLTLAAIRDRYPWPEGWLEGALSAMVEAGEAVRGYLTPGALEPEWCDRTVLERIHRRTLAILRHEVQPVGIAALADFAVRWQGLHPAHRRSGEQGLVQALQALRGVSLPAVVWTRDVLPGRVEGLGPRALDDLADRGELVWVAGGTGDARRARARLFFRGEGSLYAPVSPEAVDALGEAARQVYDLIRREGALYTRDLRGALGMDAQALQAALLELVLAGLVTNDRFEVLERLVAGEWAPREERGVTSSLDADLEAWRSERRGTVAPLQRPRPSRLRRAARRAATRAEPPADLPGRWAAVASLGIQGRPLDPQGPERAERLARTLLQRYGVVSRASLRAEEGDWAWADVYPVFQLMELRGEVRRGYFCRGLPGLQYALPEAVDALREWNGPEAEGREDLVLMNACDPANVYAWPLADVPEAAAEDGQEEGAPPLDAAPESLADGLARLPSNYLVLRRGVPVLTYEHGSGAWRALAGASEETLRGALLLALGHLTREGGICTQPTRVPVHTWNGEPPVGGPAQPLLERVGFRRDTPSMVWER